MVDFERPDSGRALNLCHLCPKLCHSSCPVADADRQESSTPWGKMSTMKKIERGELPTEKTALAYKCLDCGRAEEACALKNPVFDTLQFYREKAFDNRTAPEALYDYCDNFSRFNNPFQKDLKQILLRHLPDEMSSRPRAGIYFPGCVEIACRPKGIRPTLAFLEELGVHNLGLYQESIQCCGVPLLWAGDMERFREIAEINTHLLNRFDFIVSNAADCLYTFKHHYATHGFRIRPKILHFTQYLYPLLKRARRRPPSRQQEILYHDSCFLGRRLGVTDEPRKIIEFVTGSPPIEMFYSREDSYCCGEGGLLPVTHPELAQKITDRCLSELQHLKKGKTLMTASLACQRRLSERSPLPVVELKDFVLKELYA